MVYTEVYTEVCTGVYRGVYRNVYRMYTEDMGCTEVQTEVST